MLYTANGKYTKKKKTFGVFYICNSKSHNKKYSIVGWTVKIENYSFYLVTMARDHNMYVGQKKMSVNILPIVYCFVQGVSTLSKLK